MSPTNLERPSQTYKSKKVLGVLFRRVQADPKFEPSDIRRSAYDPEHWLWGHPQYHDIYTRLMAVKAGYECDMHYAMRRFSATELEIVSGIVTYHKQRKTSRDITEVSVSFAWAIKLTRAGIPQRPLRAYHEPVSRASAQVSRGVQPSCRLHCHADRRGARVLPNVWQAVHPAVGEARSADALGPTGSPGAIRPGSPQAQVSCGKRRR